MEQVGLGSFLDGRPPRNFTLRRTNVFFTQAETWMSALEALAGRKKKKKKKRKDVSLFSSLESVN